MAANNIQIKTTNAMGTFVVYLDQIGADTADLQILQWGVGDDILSSPTSTSSYELDDIVATPNKLTCVTHDFLLTPQIEINIIDSPPSIDIIVSHVMFAPAPTTIPVQTSDIATFRQWLTACNFPSS